MLRKLKITKPDETSRTLEARDVSVGAGGELYVSGETESVAVFAAGQWTSAVFGKEVTK